MTRVIANGDWTWRFVCKGCRALGEAGHQHVRLDEAAAAETESADFDFYAECDRCGTRNYIPAGEITPGIEEDVRERAAL